MGKINRPSICDEIGPRCGNGPRLGTSPRSESYIYDATSNRNKCLSPLEGIYCISDKTSSIQCTINYTTDGAIIPLVFNLIILMFQWLILIFFCIKNCCRYSAKRIRTYIICYNPVLIFHTLLIKSKHKYKLITVCSRSNS